MSFFNTFRIEVVVKSTLTSCNFRHSLLSGMMPSLLVTNRYLDNASSPRMPFGIVPLAKPLPESVWLKICFSLRRSLENKRFHRIDTQGPDDGYEGALTEFLTQCIDQGLSQTGTVYIFDLMGLASYLKEERCLLDFSVRVI